MPQPKPAEPRFTFGDYVQWTDGHRWELHEGEARLMSPAPARSHQHVVFRLAGQVGPFLEGHRCQGFLAPFDVRLPIGDEPDEAIATVLQPDLLVVCDPAQLDERGCRGAPDWIVEVLSPSTRGDDLVRKRRLYEQHGVRELWIVDPAARVLQRLTRGSGGSGFRETTEPAVGRTPVEVLPGLEIDWNRVFRA